MAHSNSTIYQYLLVFCANIITISYGTAVGWTSAALLVLESDDTPLETGPLRLSEVAWVAAIFGVGGTIGTLVGGWTCERFGRKPTLLISGLPMALGWILILYAQNPWYLYSARFISGFSGSLAFVAIPFLVAEVADDSIRGALASMLTVATNGGVLTGFIVGNFFDYNTVPKILIGFPVLFVICYQFFPESPWYLVHSNRLVEAEASLRFYRNMKLNVDKKVEEVFQLEFQRLRVLHEEAMKEKLTKPSVTMADFVCKPVVIGVMVFLILDFCGVLTMVSYAGKIFTEAGTKIDPNEAVVVVGFIQLVGTYLSTMTVDRVGRKVLFSASCMGTGVCYCALATYIYLSNQMDLSHLHWVPVISFGGILFIASIGVLPIPYVMLAEILPHKIKGVMVPFCLCYSWLQAAIIVKAFPYVAALVGFHGCLYIFGACCFSGALYIIFCIPETKGKSLDDIEKYLMKHKQ